MNCSNCNAKNNKSSKYCSNCGKKIVEDSYELNINNIFNSIINDIKGMFIYPIDTIKKFCINNNNSLSLIYLCFNIIITSLILTFFIHLYSYSYSNFNVTLEYYNYVTTISYFKIFLVISIYQIVIYGLLSSVIYLISNYILNKKENINRIISWLSINSLLLTCLLVIITISYIISNKLGLLVLLLSIIIFIYNLFSSFKYSVSVDENKLGYILMISIITTSLIVIYILPKLLY